MPPDSAVARWRVFVAVFPDAAAVDAISRAIQRVATTHETSELRWLSQQQLHITLRFIGSVPVDAVAGIRAACAGAALSCDGFELEVCGAGAFATARRASVLWLGLGSGAEPLCALAARVNAAFDSQGFAPELRAFRPHLTIARSKRPRSLLRTIESLGSLCVRSRVGEFVLVRSHLGSQGARYEVLERFALRA